jgi:hypothetical protein
MKVDASKGVSKFTRFSNCNVEGHTYPNFQFELVAKESKQSNHDDVHLLSLINQTRNQKFVLIRVTLEINVF